MAKPAKNPTPNSYKTLCAEIWRPASTSKLQGTELLEELVRYATLAANSHNTQPWRFHLDENRISLLPDFDRSCPAVDPDNHHLYTSLGCAIENLVLAAEAFGLRSRISSDSRSVQIDLEPGVTYRSPLFEAIPKRQCSRAKYSDMPVTAEQSRMLSQATERQGVSTKIFTDKTNLEEISKYVTAGNSLQMADKEFVEELKNWIRFSESAVLEHRDGLYAESAGNPSAPDWIGRIAFKLSFKVNKENAKHREQILSSSGVIAFIGDQETPESWIDVGRSYERFALQATALGLSHAFINQAIEVPETRTQFARYLDAGDRRPDLLVRFGYGPTMPRSLRRPIEQVID